MCTGQKAVLHAEGQTHSIVYRKKSFNEAYMKTVKKTNPTKRNQNRLTD